MWEGLELSHAFFTSPAYKEFNTVVQPALNGRRVQWTQHALIGLSDLNDLAHFQSIIESAAIEVALTNVVEGGVAGYYEQFRKYVAPILDGDLGCNGYFISPQIENPQNQMLLINWKSVDVSSHS